MFKLNEQILELKERISELEEHIDVMECTIENRLDSIIEYLKILHEHSWF